MLKTVHFIPSFCHSHYFHGRSYTPPNHIVWIQTALNLQTPDKIQKSNQLPLTPSEALLFPLGNQLSCRNCKEVDRRKTEARKAGPSDNTTRKRWLTSVVCNKPWTGGQTDGRMDGHPCSSSEFHPWYLALILLRYNVNKPPSWAPDPWTGTKINYKPKVKNCDQHRREPSPGPIHKQMFGWRADDGDRHTRKTLEAGIFT